jgi:hypothetical protein
VNANADLQPTHYNPGIFTQNMIAMATLHHACIIQVDIFQNKIDMVKIFVPSLS